MINGTSRLDPCWCLGFFCSPARILLRSRRMSAISELKRAKEHSDKRQYGVKHQIIKKMMTDDPDAFFIDSDDGKGIVGVTHKQTGFRFHMPAGKVKPGLSKEAGRLDSLLAAAKPLADGAKGNVGKLSDAFLLKLKNNPALEQRVRSALSYNLVDPRNRNSNTLAASAVGMIPGAVAGTAVSDETGAGAGGGALGGALMGAAGGRYGPRGIQLGLGRILTNIMKPVSYQAGSHDYLKTQKLSDMVRAVMHDKPIHAAAPEAAGRHALFRDYFGMDRNANSSTYFKDIATGADGRKTTTLNPAHKGAKAIDDEVSSQRRASLYTSTKDQGRKMKLGEQTLTTAGPMGNFHIAPDGKWEDTWDFALHPHERIDSAKNLMRELVTPFGQPTTVVGKTLSQAGALALPMNPRRFKNIDDSFVSPLAAQLAKSYGIDPSEAMNMVRRMGGRAKHNGTVREAIEGAIAGKQNTLDPKVLQSMWRPPEVE